MDFIESLPKSDGKDTILVVIDKYTKYAHLVSLQHPFTASQVAQKLLDQVIKLYGPPKVIISDRDKIFTSGFWSELFKIMGTATHLTSAYHPQSDGQSERLNQCVEMYLRCLVHDKPNSWSKWLPMAEWWYNTSHHSAINMTPYMALYGKPPPSVNYHQAEKQQNPCLDLFLRQRAEMQGVLKENLKKAQERMVFYANKNRSERKFLVGDEVFLKTQAFRQRSLKETKDHKFSPRYYGPFKVLKKIGSVAYQIQLPATAKIHNTFHVSLLKKKVGSRHMVWSEIPTETGGVEEKRPARILDRRIMKRNNAVAVDVLMQWDGQVAEDATWEDFDVIRRRYPWFTGEDAASQERGIVKK